MMLRGQNLRLQEQAEIVEGAADRPALTIRRAEKEDRPALAEMFLRARRKAFHWREPEDFFLTDYAEQTRGEIVWVAVFPDGRPAGFISVWEQDQFIHHLFVDPAYQGRGIGRMLLESLASWLPQPWQLKCLAANRPALAFYEKLGWEEAGTGGRGMGAYILLEYFQRDWRE